jgi:hypothetical protein
VSAALEQPAMVFDDLTSEWFATVVDASNGTLLVAAAMSPLATALRFVSSVPVYPNERPVFPSIGVSEWMVGIAANDVNETTGNLDGTGYILLNRTDLFSGVLYYYEVNPQNWFPNGHADAQLSPSPAQWFGGIAPAPSPGVAYWVRWTGAPPALPSFQSAGPKVTAFSPAPPVPQPGTSDLLNASGGYDGRVDSSLWQDGVETLVFATGTGCPSSLGCIDLVQVSTASGILRQDLSIGGSSFALFDPSVGADAQGDLTITAVSASGSTYPSILVLGQAWNEPNVTANGTFVAAAGTGAVTSGCNLANVCPFGAESAAAPDPDSDSVWSVAEFGVNPGNWSTWIQPAETRNATIMLSASPPVLDLGQAIAIRAVPSGGSSALSDFRWSGLPTGCRANDSPILRCVPSEVGTYVVRVTANDSYPTTVAASVSVTIFADPSVSTPVASAPGADAGQTRTFAAVVSFGIPPYTYQWSGLPVGNCTNTTTSTVSCVLPTAGNLSIRAAVNDSTGTDSTSPALAYEVAPPIDVQGLGGFNDTSQGGLYAPVTFEVFVSGGAAPLQYSWSGLPAPCGPASGAQVVCTPATAGHFDVSVRITDANGAMVNVGPLAWTVPGAPTSAGASGPFGLPGLEGWVLVAGLGTIGTFAAILVGVRRRRPPVEPGATRGPFDDE